MQRNSPDVPGPQRIRHVFLVEAGEGVTLPSHNISALLANRKVLAVSFVGRRKRR
ncbi:MAG TPA: hypothetical protein VI855_08160 [Dehalococcoidia bacterium]|nr:hypothetical protein [Dehalococcoidia bacterium]